MKVKDVMTAWVEVVNPDANLVEVASQMRDLNVGMIPVCDGERVLGIITDRDIAIRAIAEGRDPKTTRARDVMSPDVHFIREYQDISEAADLMKSEQIRRLLVLDQNKRLVGVLSLGDLAVDSPDEQLTGETLKNVSEPAEPRR